MFNGDKHRIEKNEHDDDPVERLTLYQMAHSNPKTSIQKLVAGFQIMTSNITVGFII